MQSYMAGFYPSTIVSGWERDGVWNKFIPLIIAQIPDMDVPADHIIKQFCEEGKEGGLFGGTKHAIGTG